MSARIGSNMYQIAVWEESEMRNISVGEIEEYYEKEWDKVADGRYRSV